MVKHNGTMSLCLFILVKLQKPALKYNESIWTSGHDTFILEETVTL